MKETFNQYCLPKIQKLGSQDVLIARGVRNECIGKVLVSLILQLPNESEPSTPMFIPWLVVREDYRSFVIDHLLMCMAHRIQIHQMDRVDIFLVADYEIEQLCQCYKREELVLIDGKDNENIDQLGGRMITYMNATLPCA